MGIPVTHPGRVNGICVPSVFTQAVIRSAFSMIATTASEKGTTNRSSMASVIAATASPRFPPSQPSTRNMSGQVAATIITAQMSDDRNGLMIQKLAAIRSPIQRTCSVARVKSGGESLCIVISLPRFSFGGKSFLCIVSSP